MLTSRPRPSAPATLRARARTLRRTIAIAVLAAVVTAPAFVCPAAAGTTQAASLAKPDPLDQGQLAGLEWRNIGPWRGGRVTAVTGVPGQRNVCYFGGTGSGIWKSTDSGMSWNNVSDGELGTGSVGAIAVAPSDPNVLYAGMGEGCIRGNVSHGDGVYRSVDGGRSWRKTGLGDARQIGRVRVDPRDPGLAYVAALGHTFGPSRERGVFRTRDGGATWKCVLFVNDSTGAIDLALDATNPRVLYATTWQVHRTPWSLESGGPGSGLWKSVDGGDTWRRLTGGGLPKGIWGRSGVAVSPANPDRVWAMIEADDGGLYRSDDAGRTWRRVNEDRNLRQRAWYYTHVYADPKNADVVYVLNVQCLRSGDGGRSFRPLPAPHGDHHDLWLDPDDPQRMIESNDGGACVSFDGGLSWTSQDNQPTAQFYHVITDDGFPYKVYGAQQDNSTVAIASRTDGFGIGRTDWYPVGGGESGFIAPKPGDPEIVYAGSYDGYLSRLDHRTGQERDVNPWPDNPMGWGAEGARYRFQWTFPIVISPHDPNTLYACSNVVHRSTDEGQSWQVVSPDLTRHDPAKLGPSGGPITKDNTSVEYYCTIFAMAESPRAPGLLWVGSDDGLVHVSRDAGRAWQDVTPPGLPPWSLISQIAPSPHDPGTAYVAANRYKLDDHRPYAFVTHDYGRTWRPIAGDLPGDGFVRVVREDPVRRGLLFCGTETGIYWSSDEGARWRPLRLNRPGLIADLDQPDGQARGALPVVPITDLVVRDQDLVVATQGRSFWILDDIAPLRQLTAEAAAANAWLFAPSPAYLFGGPPGGGRNAGANPPYGAVIYYRLAAEPKEGQEVTLEFLDASGKLVRRFSNRPDPAEEEAAPPPGGEEEPFFGRRGGPRTIPTKAGLNRFAWDLRYPEAKRFKGMILWGGGLQGPTVVPGQYQVRLTAGGTSQTRRFEVRKDPRLATTPADYQKRFDLHLKIRDKLTETHEAITRLRDARDQLQAVAERAKLAAPKDTAIAAAARKLAAGLTSVEEALYQTRNRSSQDPLNFPIRLNNKLSSLTGVVAGADAPPTAQSVTVYDDVAGRIDVELAKLKKLLGEDLAAFNRLVREREVPAVVLRAAAPASTSATSTTPASTPATSAAPASTAAAGAAPASAPATSAAPASVPAADATPPLPPELDPLVQNMNTGVSPGADFFQYACGRWLREHPIPAAERGWGIANLVREETYSQLVGICESAARSGAVRGSSEQKVGDFWTSGMDSVAVDRQGAAPLKPYLDRIAAIRTRQDLLQTIALFQVRGLRPLYSLYVGQDERDSERYLVHLYQGGLRLPDRDYYFNDDSTTRHVRAEYARHVAAMFRLLGESAEQARRSSRTIVEIETELARRSRTLEQRRDPWANYNKMAMARLVSLAPAIAWDRQFAAMGIAAVDTVIVGQPEFLAQADSLLKALPVPAWKTYLRWNLVSRLAPFLSRPFDLENFRFYGTVMSGTKAQRPRWKRVLDAEEDGIGELLGQVWVRQYCSPATKARYEKLTEDILGVYRDRIRGLPWMSEATRERALAKLDHVTRKVAYPDRWRDYSALQLDRGSYTANQIRINEWWFRHEADKLGKPIDRTEWDMTPQTYNAYYNESKVEIVLPAAAFMLPGLPDSLVDDAILYSYAGGSTIGHEITHGFDDEGRQFDDHGNLSPWWTEQDSVQFTGRAEKLVQQFDQYVVGEKHVRGRATLGENIADLGGVVLGYEAFKKTDQWKKGEKLNGFTPDQRYFLGYALSWLGQRRPESLAQQIMTDVHSPQFLRVNGPLANVPEFYDAFGVKAGDAMWRPDSVRVVIW